MKPKEKYNRHKSTNTPRHKESAMVLEFIAAIDKLKREGYVPWYEKYRQPTYR